MLIGRRNEIQSLNGFFEGDSAGVAVVSGSIGVGKTTLLQEFAKEKNAIFFDAYETTGKHQLERLGKLMEIENIDAEGFCKEITERASKEKILIIIDQYPNFVKADPDFDKLLYFQ